jgi:3-hydroxybutyryl-CoA dehydrogenase
MANATMHYAILDTGGSHSFPAEHALLAGAAKDLKSADIVILLGEHAGRHAKSLPEWKDKVAVLIELGTESLGTFTGESRAEEGSNALGFARFRLGDAEPTNLVELVRQPRTSEASIAAAKLMFEDAGLQVAVCGDFAGRIIDRLVRPYYNAALRRLDDGLATADDLDTTLKLGLGYPEGPVALLERTGLAQHCDVTQALFEATGEQAYAPARRARVAKLRQRKT